MYEGTTNDLRPWISYVLESVAFCTLQKKQNSIDLLSQDLVMMTRYSDTNEEEKKTVHDTYTEKNNN